MRQTTDFLTLIQAVTAARTHLPAGLAERMVDAMCVEFRNRIQPDCADAVLEHLRNPDVGRPVVAVAPLATSEEAAGGSPPDEAVRPDPGARPEGRVGARANRARKPVSEVPG